MHFIKIIFRILVGFFAIIGFIFSGVFVAMKLGLTNVRGTIAERNQSFYENLNTNKPANSQNGIQVVKTPYLWSNSQEWGVLKAAFSRDQDTIKRAASDAGISPRILLGGVIGEQFRFFTSKRDSFKSYFEPLKILANLTSFSFGIAGLKSETVARIDENLKNPNSVFYLGKDMEQVITYPEGADIEKTRFDRITNAKDGYYSYLYVGLFMRQVTAQWLAAGYDISQSPGILATLYNLGFNRSIPKATAAPGGAIITVDGQDYSFGELGDEFYYSGELLQEFPN